MFTSHSRRTGAMLAAATAAALTLAGCGSGTNGGTKGGAGELVTWTPKPTSEVESITWNLGTGEPDKLDPANAVDYAPNTVHSILCENLLVQTPEFEIKPNLASSVANPDELTWVYTLRDDVTFWDGSPMTADDVVYSLQRTRKGFLYGYLFANVKSIAATGDHEVTVKLTSPDYLFNDELASSAGVVVQKKYASAHEKDFGTAGGGMMCTGPYKYDSWTQGQKISVERYDDYWNDAAPLKVKHIDFTFLTDDAAITSGLVSGEIDGTFNTPTSGRSQLAAAKDKGTLHFGPSPLTVTLIAANQKGPLGDERVRKALNMAVDWKGILAQIYGGNGSVGALQTPRSVFGFAKDGLTGLADEIRTDGTQQIEEARRLLADVPAELKQTEISLVVPSQQETQQLGVSVKDAADKLGLNFTLNVVPADNYTAYLFDPATRGDTDLIYTQFWPYIPNPLDWLGATAVTLGSFNQGGYGGIDATFGKAVATQDEGERAALVVAMEKQLNDEMNPMFPGIELNNDVWLGSRITGAPAAFAYVFFPWAAYLGGTGE